MAQKDTAAQSPFDVRYHGQGERELLMHVLRHLHRQEERLDKLEESVQLTRESAGRTEGSVGRTESRVMELIETLGDVEDTVAMINEGSDRIDKQIDSIVKGT